MKNFLTRLLFILSTVVCILFAQNNMYAQTGPDSNRRSVSVVDTAGNLSKAAIVSSNLSSISKPHKFQPNPKRAGLYSAILPGLGQFYNRQYWKVPVIYAGLAVAGYFFVDNLNNYQSYRKAYVARINNPYYTDKYTNIYSSEQLQQLQNDYNKFLDMTVLFTGIGYTLQILEAMTGAHLKNFDISRDISMQVQPMVRPEAVGLGMVFNFK